MTLRELARTLAQAAGDAEGCFYPLPLSFAGVMVAPLLISSDPPSDAATTTAGQAERLLLKRFEELGDLDAPLTAATLPGIEPVIWSAFGVTPVWNRSKGCFGRALSDSSRMTTLRSP
jgi:hypothetical protein